MANAKKDQNGRNTIIAASNADGQTIVQVKADPTNHGLAVDDASTGTDNGNNLGNAMLDENSVAVWTAVSEADGTTIIEIYADPLTGKILIDSN